MYSNQDLDDAVASGALSPDAAASLRNFFDQQRSTSAIDEEQFRLVTSFNDIFVSIASAILLFAVGYIAQSVGQSLGLIIDQDGPSPLAPAAIAATAWGLATFFTAKRRMALPSIILLLAFVGGVLATVGFSLVLAVGQGNLENNQTLGGIIGAVAAAVELSVALTALIIGSALLMLSAYWHQARRLVVNRLPGELVTKLPHLDRVISPQPAA